MKSILFVVIQFAALGLIVVTGPVVPANPWLQVLEFLGILLGVWAILSMGPGNFNITPDVKRESELVTAGPYRWIRHPMYAALLLATLPLALDALSPVRIGLWIVLLVDLVLKLNYEEGLLQAAHKGYGKYMQKSWRLVPFIY